MKLERKILDREFKQYGSKYKNASKKVLRKKDSNSTKKKGNAEWNIQKSKKKEQYMAGIEVNTKKNIWHYVYVGTNGWN